jgi:hypothetical protein
MKSQVLFECDTCAGSYPASKFNLECPNPETCFRCRVQGTQFGYGGYRQQFHEGTNAERTRNIVAEARSQGHDPVPVHTAGGHGPSARQMSQLSEHLKAQKVSPAL